MNKATRGSNTMERPESPWSRTPASHTRSLTREGALEHCESVTSPVYNPAGGRRGRLLGQRRIQLALACRLEIVATGVVEVHPVLDNDLLAEVLRHVRGHRDGPLVVDGALSIGHREAIDCQRALGAGVTLGGQRHLDGPVVR